MHPLPLATQLRAAVLSGVFLAIAVPACLGINFELRATTQYQLEEWSLTNGSHSGNPFDLEATVTFEHDDGTRRTTGMFFDGEDTWKFRFTGVETGNWSFTTSSSDPDLDGHTGSINVAPAPAGAEGFMIRLEGDKWGKMGTNRALVPNHVMINNSLQAWDTPAERAAILDEFFGEHGFNGVHPAVIGAQFFNAEDGDRFNGDDHNTDALNPDPRTFEILEAMVQDVHARGGVMHFWPWGDSYRAQNLSTYRTPETGGVNGVVDRRLQRYFAARLGPIPGWTMGYGYDLFEWVSGPELTAWHDFMQAEMGWFHFLGARGRKNTVGQELLPDSQLSEEMDYTAYEQHFRDFEFDDWVATMNDRAGKPSFSEDRFRVTGGLGKDLTNEETRRLMWTLTMAGGIAAIWGDLDPEPVVDGEGFYGSGAYDNKEELKTFGVFWNDHRRFLESMEVGDQGQNDARVLVSEDRGNWVLYQENASSITVSLSGFSDPLPVVAVDAKEAYEEIPLDPAVPGTQTFNLPSTSDWAIAIGDFQPATEVPGQLDSKLRLIQESDLGGDPDDQASMVRFLLYTNEWDVEGIIVDRDPDNFADTNRHHVRYGDEQTALEMMDEHFYEAWESIYPTLSQHADGYPTAAQLRAITVAGHDDVDDGVQLILDALAKDDPRPIYYSNWGSDSGTESNLKRALDHLKANNTDAYNDALNRIINVSLDGNAPGRNRLGEHYNQLPLNVETGWPEKYGAGYGTRWYHQFRHTVGADNSDVESNHGPLGELWTGPKEGDTWCFMYLMPVGLSDPLTPAMGGWAGRYGPRADQFQGDNHWWNDEEDTVAGTGFANRHRNNTAARYDDAQANDFAARMDWCVEDFADANHPPKPVMT
ncbi:MAG: nucleoside hydrolase-like domain-containing protein, partial [Opitutales bacterium]